MNTIFQFAILCLSGLLFSSKQLVASTLPTTQIEAFIPQGYALLDSVSGDLNGDWRKDWVIVLKKSNEDSLAAIGIETTRPVIVLYSDVNSQLYQVHRADNLVYCLGCGGIWGDPYSGIELVPHGFKIYHYGGSNWRWTRNLTFFRSGNEFYLEEDASTSFKLIGEKNDELIYDTDFTSTVRTAQDFGKVRMEDFRIEQ
ncbi:MAG: hypothetical protein RLZZ77_1510 [Bacteroidota bacterium]|jgi:hypothetical protein